MRAYACALFLAAALPLHGQSSVATPRLTGITEATLPNDQDAETIELVNAPSLRVFVFLSRHRVDPGQQIEANASVDSGGAPATDFTLTLTLPAGGTFTGRIGVSEPLVTCTATADRVVCSTSSLPPNSHFTVTADAKAPDQRSGGQFVLAANVRATNFAPGGENAEWESMMNRFFDVSNVSDEGPGSLRDALLQAQQLCETEPCKIAFAIEGAPTDGRFVIRPLSMLPEVRGVVSINGGTQTLFGGDTNPGGPEIEINGSDIEGPVFGGLLLGTGCEIHVFDLAIADFPAPGLMVRSGPFDFQGCSRFHFGQSFDEDFVGSPPGSVVIARNHLTRNRRGVAVTESGSTHIEDNLITNNQRSGVFTERTGFIKIFRNRVADNGASGIFLWLVESDIYPSKVYENVVTGNAEWGIARAPFGDVYIRKNSIFGNRYPAFDVGLDFDTPNRGSDDGEGGRGIPNKPVLASAQYDPVINKTILRGRLDSVPHYLINRLRIDVYASAALSASGHGQAERWLAAVFVPDGHTDLLIELDGDLRGSYITATNERTRLYGFDVYVPNTSELSNAVKVQ